MNFKCTTSDMFGRAVNTLWGQEFHLVQNACIHKTKPDLVPGGLEKRVTGPSKILIFYVKKAKPS